MKSEAGVSDLWDVTMIHSTRLEKRSMDTDGSLSLLCQADVVRALFAWSHSGRSSADSPLGLETCYLEHCRKVSKLSLQQSSKGQSHLLQAPSPRMAFVTCGNASKTSTRSRWSRCWARPKPILHHLARMDRIIFPCATSVQRKTFLLKIAVIWHQRLYLLSAFLISIPPFFLSAVDAK